MAPAGHRQAIQTPRHRSEAALGNAALAFMSLIKPTPNGREFCVLAAASFSARERGGAEVETRCPDMVAQECETGVLALQDWSLGPQMLQ